MSDLSASSPAVWVAVPTLDGLELQVLSAHAQESSLGAQEDPGILPAFVAAQGILRGQPVLRIGVNPRYRHITTRVLWDKSAQRQEFLQPRYTSSAFENLKKALILNYDAFDHRSQAGGSEAISEPTWTTNPTSFNQGASLKIVVESDGLHALTYADLIGAGLPVDDLAPRHLSLYNQGREQAIQVIGEADGVLHPEDIILFYGTKLDTLYTDRNIYWLTVGNSDGKRFTSRSGAAMNTLQPLDAYLMTLHAEQNSHYWQTIPNGLGQDHWFWEDKFTAPETRSYPITVTHLATPSTYLSSTDFLSTHTSGLETTNAVLRVRLRGRTSHPQMPNHHTRVYLNGTLVDDQHWSDLAIFTHESAVPQSSLLDGVNNIQIEAVGDTGVDLDQFFVNWIELDYWRRYNAQGEQFVFTSPLSNTVQFEINGFLQPTVGVFDISQASDPVAISDIDITDDPGSSGPIRVRFQDEATPASRYLAASPDQWQRPASVTLDSPSNLRTPSHAADYILITHTDLITATFALAEHRRSQGLRVITVTTEDIYDEFNYGIFDPAAIREFLRYAYFHWQPPAPTYVLLVGDAYQDYRDYLKTGTINYVPSQIVETAILGQTPSDNWFVTVDGDDPLPDMLIGRLSADSPEQTAAIVDKIIDYENNAAMGPWSRRALLVADDDSSTFATTSQKLAALLSPDFLIEKVYAAEFPPGDPIAAVQASLNQGALLVNYTGHGSVTAWGTWQNQFLLDGERIAALQNTDRLDLVTMANCLSGFFAGPHSQVSVAEALLRLPNRGAVAVWAPTGLHYPAGHWELLQAFYRQIVDRARQPDLGVATTTAKLIVYNQSEFWGELVDMFVLFGDPAMKVRISEIESVYLPFLRSSE